MQTIDGIPVWGDPLPDAVRQAANCRKGADHELVRPRADQPESRLGPLTADRGRLVDASAEPPGAVFNNPRSWARPRVRADREIC